MLSANAILFGRVTYEMMEEAWRPVAQTGARPDWMPAWMEPFARTIDAAKKHVVSGTLDRVVWKAELVGGDLGEAVQRHKRERGKGLFVGGVTRSQSWGGSTSTSTSYIPGWRPTGRGSSRGCRSPST